MGAPLLQRALRCGCPSRVAGPAGTVSRLDANLLAPTLDVDLVYLDPPYNQHSFFSNYHVWETLVRWDAPASYGVANKRVDCRERRSALQLEAGGAGGPRGAARGRSRRRGCSSRSPTRASTTPTSWRPLLGEVGYVGRIDVEAKRYVGAQIGIYNPSGEKVGTVSRLRNRETLFLAGPDEALVASIAASAAGARSQRGPREQQEGRGHPRGGDEREERRLGCAERGRREQRRAGERRDPGAAPAQVGQGDRRPPRARRPAR